MLAASTIAGDKSQPAVTSAQHEAHNNALDQHVHAADNSTQKGVDLQMQWLFTRFLQSWGQSADL